MYKIKCIKVCDLVIPNEKFKEVIKMFTSDFIAFGLLEISKVDFKTFNKLECKYMTGEDEPKPYINIKDSDGNHLPVCLTYVHEDDGKFVVRYSSLKPFYK